MDEKNIMFLVMGIVLIVGIVGTVFLISSTTTGMVYIKPGRAYEVLANRGLASQAQPNVQIIDGYDPVTGEPIYTGQLGYAQTGYAGVIQTGTKSEVIRRPNTDTCSVTINNVDYVGNIRTFSNPASFNLYTCFPWNHPSVTLGYAASLNTASLTNADRCCIERDMIPATQPAVHGRAIYIPPESTLPGSAGAPY